MTRALGPGCLTRRARGRGEAVWVWDWCDSNGKRRRVSLGSDRRVAERRRVELLRARDLELAGLGTVEGQSRPLAELRELYLGDLAFRATPMHVMNVRQKLDRVLSRIAATRVRDLKPFDLMKLRNELLAEGLSARTVNLHVHSVRAMLNWAVSAGLIAESPIRALKSIRENETTQRKRRRALSDDEIERFLAAAEEDDRRCAVRLAAEVSRASGWMTTTQKAKQRGTRVPQAPLWRALLETGARYGELTSTSWADVDLDRAVLTVRAENAKSRKSRRIPLRAELVAMLRALPRGMPQSRVFLSPDGKPWCKPTNNLSRVFDRVLKLAGISRVDAEGQTLDIHALRHAFCSRLARNGVGLVQAQRLMGHSDPKLTARVYSHLDVEDLRDAVEQMTGWEQRTPSRARG